MRHTSNLELVPISGSRQLEEANTFRPFPVFIVIRIDLKDKTTLAVRARESLKKWDSRREAAGEAGWQVLLSSDLSSSAAVPDKKHIITSRLKSVQDINVPSHVLPLIKSDNTKEEVADLFEWFGLACLGSQRLQVQDAVNHYAAVYNPPINSSQGTIHHLQWTGFLSPSFVRSILEDILPNCTGLRGISALSFDSPISYIASTGTTRAGGNSWTLIASENSHGSTSKEVHWLLAEDV